MSTKQAVKPKQYLFLDENKELYVEGTEKEFLEVVVGNGENPEDIYYKMFYKSNIYFTFKTR